jgi:hypothetical protein
VGSIAKLKTSTIHGELTAPGFTPDIDATLTAAADAAINGVTFPAAAAITALAADTVTIGDYTVPADTTLTIANGSTLIIPTTKVLTLAPDAAAAGAGTIRALGEANGGSITISGTAGYLTEGAGVAGDALAAALAAFKAASVTLTNSIDLKVTFFNAGADDQYLGIGSVDALVAGGNVQNTGDGTAGDDISLGAATAFVADPAAPTVIGTDVLSISAADLTVSLDAGVLKVADSDYDDTNVKYAIITVAAGLKLKNSGLISPVALPAFSIGIKTNRA